MNPVPGQTYRAGDLPPGSVVRTGTDSEYVIGRSGCCMRWEQPIPLSEKWNVVYVGQLPPGEWMTDREWAEVAAANGGRPGGVSEVTRELFNHPDPWMDSEPGSLTIPTQWPERYRGASGNYKSRFRRYKRNLRWKSTMRKQAAHGFVPCPYCGGDIVAGADPTTLQQLYMCRNCKHRWPDTPEALREILPKGISCPKCSSEMHWRDAAGLGRMWPEGAWECSNQRCWHMMAPGEMVPDTYQDPDAPGDFTLPEHWGKG